MIDSLSSSRGSQNIDIEAIGNRIAKTRGWRSLTGTSAVHRFLIDKYGWLPREVRRLSSNDLKMLLADVSEASVPRKRKYVSLSDIQRRR